MNGEAPFFVIFVSFAVFVLKPPVLPARPRQGFVEIGIGIGIGIGIDHEHEHEHGHD